MSDRRQRLLEGPIAPALIRLAVPIILGNALQTGYQLTDAFWVGRLGASAVAAVAISFPVTFLVIALGAGFAMAGATLSAQYMGAGRQDLVNHVAAQTMLAVAVSSVILGTVGFLLTPHLLRLLGVAPDVYAGALGFMRVSFIGIIFVFLYAMFQALMRGIGETKIPLYHRARHGAVELRSRSSFHLRLGTGARPRRHRSGARHLGHAGIGGAGGHDHPVARPSWHRSRLVRSAARHRLHQARLLPRLSRFDRAVDARFGPGDHVLPGGELRHAADSGLWRRIQRRAGGHHPGDGLVDGRLDPGRPEHRRRQHAARGAHRAPGQRDRVRRALPGRYSRLRFRAAARGIFRAGRCRGDCRGRPLHPHHVPRLGRHRHSALRGGDLPGVWATC